MISVNRILCDILDNINEGIVILNENQEIVFWNKYIEDLTQMKEEKVLNISIYEAIPTLKKHYFIKIMDSVWQDGRKMFFSAAMHKDLLDFNKNINLRISKIERHNLSYILIEFINVTNDFLRIKQLKKYLKNLFVLNKKLKEKEQTIKRLAYYDGLTGLANRILFFKIADKLFENAKKTNRLLGIMFIDIDKFKLINDNHGHKVGDEILVQVAKILKESIRKEDIAARFGGDEFLILFPYIKSYDACIDIATKLNERVKKMNCLILDTEISLSIGISLLSNNDSIDELIINADKAMYNAKHEGGGRYSIN